MAETIRLLVGKGPLPLVYEGDGESWLTVYHDIDQYRPHEWPTAWVLIGHMRGLRQLRAESAVAALDLVQPDVLGDVLRADCAAADEACADARSSPDPSDDLIPLGDSGHVCAYIAAGRVTVGRVRVGETDRWIYPAVRSLALAGEIDLATVVADDVVRGIAPRLCGGEVRRKMAANIDMYLDALRRAAATAGR